MRKILAAMVGMMVGWTVMASGDILVSKDLGVSAYSASNSYAGCTPEFAFDGDMTGTTGYWLAGNFASQWIEVDLRQVRGLTRIQMLALVSPNGHSTLQIYGSNAPIRNDRSAATLLYTFDGEINDWDLLDCPLSYISCRYVQIYTVAAPGWGGWREVQVFGTELVSANLGTSAYSASNVYSTCSSDLAFDNDSGSFWLAEGLAPQWIEVDLGTTYNLNKIELCTLTPGPTVHEIYVSNSPIGNDRSRAILVHRFEEETTDWQILKADLPSLLGRYVQIYTAASTSWVGWREIRLFADPIRVPAIKQIAVDGDISDWANSTPWSQPYLPWIGSMTSTTRAKFAWNDATDMLYVAIQTDEATRPGGHPVIGFGTGLDQAAIYGNGATQLAFETIADGNLVSIMNEIHEYKMNIYPELTGNYVDSGTVGVQAAYSYAGGVWTYEIAIPLWTNWAVGQMTTKTKLSVGGSIYLYSMMQDALNGVNGTNLTWNGNPSFANPGGLNYAAKLILAGPAAVPGDANGDNKVDVSDLGILAANYGTTTGATWETGDFNNDGKVDVSDLGILAANYGTGTGAALDFNTDAKVIGLTAEAKADPQPAASTLGCGSAGLPLIAGLLLMGLFLAKLDE